jgi:hypothetical protein
MNAVDIPAVISELPVNEIKPPTPKSNVALKVVIIFVGGLVLFQAIRYYDEMKQRE